jgi:hypothetical protein
MRYHWGTATIRDKMGHLIRSDPRDSKTDVLRPLLPQHVVSKNRIGKGTWPKALHKSGCCIVENERLTEHPTRWPKRKSSGRRDMAHFVSNGCHTPLPAFFRPPDHLPTFFRPPDHLLTEDLAPSDWLPINCCLPVVRRCAASLSSAAPIRA